MSICALRNKRAVVVAVAISVFLLLGFGFPSARAFADDSSAGNDAEQADGSSAPYLDKVRRLVDVYGAPVIERSDTGSFVAGTVFAAVADFGAGHDSLLVAYLAHAMPGEVSIDEVATAYAVEVWDAASDEEDADCMYRGTLDLGGWGNAAASLRMAKLDDRWVMLQRAYDGSGGVDTRVFGFDDRGRFGELTTTRYLSFSNEKAIPLAVRDTVGYALELDYNHPANLLWELGVEPPAVERDAGIVEDGWYNASLLGGYRDITYAPIAVASEASLDGDALVFFGTLHHVDSYKGLFSREEGETVGPGFWRFELGDSVSYQLRGGSNGPSVVDRDRFADALNWAGMELELEVENGKCVTAAVCS